MNESYHEYLSGRVSMGIAFLVSLPFVDMHKTQANSFVWKK
jgi:hypothetical protein